MNNSEIVKKSLEFIEETFKDAESGHSLQHTLRVWNLAKIILEDEKHVDNLVVELGALFHSIADYKFNYGNEEIGPRIAKLFLQSIDLNQEIIKHVENIVRYTSYKGELNKIDFHSKELKIVQDADRLDAIGAIGIARTFNFGGHKNRPLYDPKLKPNLNMSKEEYMISRSTTINHFYEKLLLLKDKMHTKTAKKIAEDRHKYMEDFLKQFYSEWDFKF